MYPYLIFFFLFLGSDLAVKAQTAAGGIEEEQNVYEKVFNAPLKCAGIENFSSVEELYNEKPLLIALVFTRCAGICNPFLLQLKEQLQFHPNAGTFRVLVLSFDPHDSEGDMQMMAKRFGLVENQNWVFAVTDSIAALNQSVSFAPVWDSLRHQFDHEAMLIGVNGDGLITKKLIGIRDGHDVGLLIGSLQNVFSPSYRLPTKNSIFSCFNYDPATGKNTPGLGLLFIGLPAVITLLILFILRLVVRRQDY